VPIVRAATTDDDFDEVDLVATALAEAGKLPAALRLWNGVLTRQEREYWKGLRAFRRRFGPQPADDPGGERVVLVERPRAVLARGYRHCHNLIACHGGRGTAQFERALADRRHRTFTEALPERPVTPDGRAMTEAVFWELVEPSGAADVDERIEELGERLRGFRPKEVLQFDKLVRRYVKEANTWGLWGAAYLVNGGCSDDGFLDFRAWLILQGKKRFSQVVAEPDAMAAWVHGHLGEAEAEPLLYLADEVYEELTGKDSPAGELSAGNPKGKRWREADLPARLPKLCRLTAFTG
jgi:hypothetical protein